MTPVQLSLEDWKKFYSFYWKLPNFTTDMYFLEKVLVLIKILIIYAVFITLDNTLIDEEKFFQNS